MRVLLFILFLFPFSFRLSAEGVPYRLFSGDAVKVWTYDTMDYVALARKIFPGVRFQSLCLPNEYLSAEDDLINTAEEIAMQANAVGGFGDPFNTPQGFPGNTLVAANVLAWQLTGRAEHFDRIERAFYNALARAARDSSENERYRAAEVYVVTPQLIYGTTPDKRELYVNLYTNSTANFSLRGHSFMLDQITSMPENGSVKLRFSQFEDSLPLRLHLRMPDWSVRRNQIGGGFVFVGGKVSLPKIYINGHEQEGLVMDSAGYVVLERNWRSREEVFIDFDLSPVYLRHTFEGREVRGAVALQRGPLVYLVTDDTKGCYFSTNQLPRFNQGTLTGRMFQDEKVPEDACAPERIYRARPYADGVKGTLWQREIR